MTAVTITAPAELEPAPVGTIVRSHVSPEAIAASAEHWTPAKLAELSRALTEAFEREMVNPDVVDVVNIAVGEVALDLEADDPRRRALGRVQDGLDSLWGATLSEAVAS